MFLAASEDQRCTNPRCSAVTTACVRSQKWTFSRFTVRGDPLFVNSSTRSRGQTCGSSFVPQRHEWVHLRRTAGGDIGCSKAYAAQGKCSKGKRSRIGGPIIQFRPKA